MHYRLIDADGGVIATEALGDALNSLHDRMTEAVYDAIEDFFADFEFDVKFSGFQHPGAKI